MSPAGRGFELFRADDSVWRLATRWDPADDLVLNVQACEASNGDINLYAADQGTAPVAIELELRRRHTLL